MTAPRQVLPGTTYLVSRRCLERRFFLRPSAEINATIGYILAVAAARYGVQLHAYCVLSNHLHLVLTDPDAKLPAFERDLDSLVARATNAMLGRWEYFWDPAGYSAVALEDPHAVVEKMVYVLANPVASGLVRRAADWPGLWSHPASIGGAPIAVARPSGFFRERGPMPSQAHLQLHLPPGILSGEAFAAKMLDLLRDVEDRTAAAHGATGRSFLGVARILAQRPSAQPPTLEPRRTLRPRVASRNQLTRADALRRLRNFVQDYRVARAAWCRGLRDVLFPPGTYLMRVVHAAPCAPIG